MTDKDKALLIEADRVIDVAASHLYVIENENEQLKAEIEQLHRLLEDRLNDLKIIGDNNEKLLRQIVRLRTGLEAVLKCNSLGAAHVMAQAALKSSNEQP